MLYPGEVLFLLSQHVERDADKVFVIEPRCEKTGLRDFRPGPTQTRLC